MAPSVDIYSISGMKVATMDGANGLAGLPKGVYVVNGRKRVVR
jgi:hypothetical protein